MALKYTAEGSPVTVLSADLNTLTNNSLSAASATQSNDGASERFPFCSVEIFVNTQGTNRSAGAAVVLYIIPEVDGTNFGNTTNACAENYVATTFSLDDASTGSRYLTRSGIPLPPTDYQVRLRNATGQDLASSGNTVKISPYSYENV